MLRVVAASLVFLALVACRDEVDPVDVPFEGIEPTADSDRDKPVPPPGDSAASDTGGEPSTPSAPKSNPNAAQASVVQACCGALRAAAKRATDEGTRAVNQQAAAVCDQKAQEVRVGRTTASKALSAVRGSLLTSAPSACKN